MKAFTVIALIGATQSIKIRQHTHDFGHDHSDHHPADPLPHCEVHGALGWHTADAIVNVDNHDYWCFDDCMRAGGEMRDNIHGRWCKWPDTVTPIDDGHDTTDEDSDDPHGHDMPTCRNHDALGWHRADAIDGHNNHDYYCFDDCFEAGGTMYVNGDGRYCV